MKRFLRAAAALLLILRLSVPALAVGPAESDVYSSQLTAAARTIYDALNAPENLEKFYTGDGIEIDLQMGYETFCQQAEALFSAESYAFSALELNHPELFWLGGSNVDYTYDEVRDEMKMLVYPALEENWITGDRSTEDDAAAVAAAVEKLAEEARAQGGAYEQLLYVHDWLTCNNAYNTDAVYGVSDGGYLPWTPLSALTDVGQPICEGYSKAFKLVCDALGIPCLTVDGNAGGGHMWNHVLLFGSWYAVDVTWDDPIRPELGVCSGDESRAFFLVGADTVPEGETLSFSESHVPDGMRIMGTSFAFPALAEAAFDPAAPHDDGAQDPPAASGPFEDVAETDYFRDAVLWAYSAEPQVTNGMDGTHFGPLLTVTRGQAVTFLWRAMGCPEPETAENPFEDVPESQYYCKPVLWAVENGITKGTDDTHFSPDQTCSTAHILTFLYRTLGAGTDGWYQAAEAWARDAGILEGLAVEVAPGVDCPRCDVVCFLYRALGGETGTDTV